VSAPDLLVIVAPNGLGHTRRTLGVVGRLVERGADLRIDVVAASWQRQAARSWSSGMLLDRAGDRIRWHLGITEPGVTWFSDPTPYADGRLTGWERRLEALPELGTARVVLSDNLAGVLGPRPDARLAGSFLWCDVLGAAFPDDPAVAAFVAHERDLLERHRPPMLCVRDLVMPGVRSATRTVEVGWMCPGHERAPRSASAVAVLGGRTGAADDRLGAVAGALEARGLPVVGQPERAGAAGWERVAVAVCRPGVGTLTDCVQWGIPMVCVSEAGNIEMAHNAARIEALGFGVDRSEGMAADRVVAAVLTLLEPETREEVRQRMAAADRAGLDEGAEWLALQCGVPLPAPRSPQDAS